MKRLSGWWFLVVAFLLLPGLTVRAQDGMEPEEPESGYGPGEDEGESFEESMAAAMKQMKAMVDGMVAFVGDKRLTETDVSMLLEHYESFDAYGEGTDEDDEDRVDPMEDRLEEYYREHGKYDFAIVLKDPAYRAWAGKAGVEPRTWLRAMIRTTLIFMREDIQQGLKEQKEAMPEQLAQLEEVRKMYGEEAWLQMKAGLEQGQKMLEQSEKTMAAIPAPDASEKKLLEEHGKALRVMIDGEDDEEDWDDEDWDEEDMDEDEEDIEDEDMDDDD